MPSLFYKLKSFLFKINTAPPSTSSSPPYAYTMSSKVESLISLISSGVESANATALSEKIPVNVLESPAPFKICWEIFFLIRLLKIRLMNILV